MNRQSKEPRFRANITALPGSWIILSFILMMQLIFPGRSATGDDKASSLLSSGIKALKESNYRRCEADLGECLDAARKSGDPDIEAEAYLWRARLHLETRRYNQALEDSEESLALFQKLRNNDRIFSSRILHATALFEKDRHVDSLIELEEISKMASPLLSKESLFDFYILRGMTLERKKEYELAGKNYDEAAGVSKEIEDKGRLIIARSHIALLHAEKKEFDKALATSLQALEQAERDNRPYLTALLLERSGKIDVAAANYDDAIRCFTGALGYYRMIENEGARAEAYLKLASIYANMSRWDEGFDCALKALDISSSSHNFFCSIKASDWALSLIFFLEEKEKLGELLNLLEKSGRDSEDPLDAAWALYKKGNYLHKICRDHQGAISAYEESAKIYRENRHKRGETRSLSEKASVLAILGRSEESLRLFDLALSTISSETQLDEPGDRDFFNIYGPGALYRKKGEILHTQSLYNDSLETCEKALLKDEGKLRLFSRICDRVGIIRESIATFNLERVEREAFLTLKEIGELEDARERAFSCNSLIMALINPGGSKGLKGYTEIYSIKNATAKKVIEKICTDQALLSQFLGGYRELIAYEHEKKNHINEGLAYLFLGFFYYAGDKSAESKDALAHSIELLKKSNFSQLEAVGLFFMALILVDEDKKDEGEKLVEKSLELFRKSESIDNELSLLAYLGMLTREMGKMAKSRESYEEALAILKNYPNARHYASIQTGLGYTNHLMKNYRESMDCYERALKYLDETGDRSLEALCHFYIGRNHGALGEKKEAAKYFLKAFAEFKNMGSAFDGRDVAFELGKIYEDEGREEEALKIYLESLDEICRVGQRIHLKNSSKKLHEGSPTWILFEKTISLLIKLGRYDEALKYFEYSGSYDLLGSIDLRAINTGDEKLKSLMGKMEELGDRMRLLQEDLKSSGDQKRKDYIEGILASTRQQFFEVINEIRARNPDYERLISVQGADLAELQRVIPEDTLLLQYYPSADGLYIFMVSKESFAIKRVDVARDRLYGMVKELRSALEKGRDNIPQFRKNSYLLYSLLIKPAKEEISKKRVIEIIPSGLLWYVPFEALGEDEKSYFIDEKEVGYLYSSDISRLLHTAKKEVKSTILAIGNPSGANLPQAAVEVEKIGKIFPKSRIFTGKDATKERLFSESKDATFLHIASHSELNREDINKSYVQLADGPLTLGEIYGLSLTGATLVVLSSCESAIGEDNPGREFASLASAFSIAGSPSVIASLWKVEDNSTAILLEEFYRNLLKGSTKSEALRLAKISVRKDPSRSSPFYWAGFVLLGDWR